MKKTVTLEEVRPKLAYIVDCSFGQLTVNDMELGRLEQTTSPDLPFFRHAGVDMGLTEWLGLLQSAQGDIKLKVEQLRNEVIGAEARCRLVYRTQVRLSSFYGEKISTKGETEAKLSAPAPDYLFESYVLTGKDSAETLRNLRSQLIDFENQLYRLTNSIALINKLIGVTQTLNANNRIL